LLLTDDSNGGLDDSVDDGIDDDDDDAADADGRGGSGGDDGDDDTNADGPGVSAGNDPDVSADAVVGRCPGGGPLGGGGPPLDGGSLKFDTGTDDDNISDGSGGGCGGGPWLAGFELLDGTDGVDPGPAAFFCLNFSAFCASLSWGGGGCLVGIITLRPPPSCTRLVSAAWNELSGFAFEDDELVESPEPPEPPDGTCFLSLTPWMP